MATQAMQITKEILLGFVGGQFIRGTIPVDYQGNIREITMRTGPSHTTQIDIAYDWIATKQPSRPRVSELPGMVTFLIKQDRMGIEHDTGKLEAVADNGTLQLIPAGHREELDPKTYGQPAVA